MRKHAVNLGFAQGKMQVKSKKPGSSAVGLFLCASMGGHVTWRAGRELALARNLIVLTVDDEFVAFRRIRPSTYSDSYKHLF